MYRYIIYNIYYKKNLRVLDVQPNKPWMLPVPMYRKKEIFLDKPVKYSVSIWIKC